jgi:hypothetical protein
MLKKLVGEDSKVEGKKGREGQKVRRKLKRVEVKRNMKPPLGVA